MGVRRTGLVALVAVVGLVGGLVPVGSAAGVVKVASSTLVAVDVPSSVAGQSVTLTATVTSVVPVSGLVVFRAGSVLLGSASVVGSVAVLSTVKLPIGSLALTATFKGSLTVLASTSAPVSFTVAKASSTTVLGVVPSLSVAGQPVSLSATVGVVEAGAPVPTGSVVFRNGTTSLGSKALAGGVAMLVSSKLPVGALSLTATYVGSTKTAGSVSVPVDATVVKASTSMSLVASSVNPVAGESVTVTARVMVAAPSVEVASGAVKFYRGTVLVKSVSLVGGVASFTSTTLPAGPLVLRATYVGSARMLGSSVESPSLALRSTATQLSGGSAPLGSAVYLTAFVAPVGSFDAVSGSVVFRDGGTVIGSVAIAGNYASLPVSTLGVGGHAVTAAYEGDATFAGSVSAATEVTVTAGSVTVTVTADANPVVVGDAVTFTATVVPTIVGNPVPSGSVTFTGGGSVVSVVLVDGVGSWVTSGLSRGMPPIVASYGGDGNYDPAESDALYEVVQSAPSTITLVSDANPVTVGESVTFTATVSGSGPGALTGSVLFRDGDTLLAAVPVTDGSAQFTTSALATGSHAMTASYSSDATHSASISTVLDQGVGFVGRSLYAWGENKTGELGLGSPDSYRTTPVLASPEPGWAQVSAYLARSTGIKADGTLWSWGYNIQGALGIGTTVGPETCPGTNPEPSPCSTIPVQVGTAHDWVFVTTGGFDTIAIKADGSMWGFGWNYFGELGDGTKTARTSPVRIGAGTAWRSASLSGDHGVAIATDGTMWSWGSNFYGGLGDGTTTDHLTPQRVSPTTDWADIRAGDFNTIALTTEGTIWAWGYNFYGQLGDGTRTNALTPIEIDNSTDWAAISSGGDTTAALKTDGSLWTWGWDAYGQLGDRDPNAYPPNHYCYHYCSMTPHQVGADHDWATVSAGEVHIYAIKTDGTLWGSGLNTHGALGDGTTIERHTPVRIGLNNRWSTVSAGAEHNLALSAAVLPATATTLTSNNNPAYTQEPVTLSASVASTAGTPTGSVTFLDGTNTLATIPLQNGTATITTTTLTAGLHPIVARYDGDANFASSAPSLAQYVNLRPTTASISASSAPIYQRADVRFTARIRAAGSATGTPTGTVRFSEGTNTLATVSLSAGDASFVTSGLSPGTHTVTATFAPTVAWAGASATSTVTVIPAVVGISAGNGYTCEVTSTHGVKCWGKNDKGQLGNGTKIDSATAVNVVGLASGVAAVRAGQDHTCAILLSGGVKCWGANQAGQLGDGSTIGRSSPVSVVGLAGVRDVDPGGFTSTCALTNGGAVKCWGGNLLGQLGNGAPTSATFSTPVDVSGLGSGASAIGVGRDHACALTGATVVCWGANGLGALGNGTLFPNLSTTPTVALTLGTGATALGAGSYDACALTTAGGIRCWGGGESGETGWGSAPFTYSATAIDVVSLGNLVVTSIAIGYNTSCATTSSGLVACWGVAMNRSNVPVVVNGLPGLVDAISAGESHACALMHIGPPKCWGNNFYGQLGNGVATNTFATQDPVDAPIA